MPTISKVLVANRGEIAVRVIRAAKDAGLGSVAVYAEPDADAPHVKLADEAFALGGQTSAESYLDFAKILDAAAKSGANAIHPGYGFLSENADFAQAVIDAGLIWIGPSPQSIRDLGDKVTARHIAARAQAPLVPGTPDPVKNADEVIAFANLARVIAPHELPDLDANDIQGTNLQHALMLASRFLDRHRDAEPVVLVVTDGEPTAHLDRDGEWWFNWPPTQETIAVTVAEVDRLTRRGIPISWFRLGDDPSLAEFLDGMARRNGGRVLAATGERLGDYVVTDYLRRRQGRRRSA